MPQDPNAHLDHTVLDIIDHSPVGAVPATPTYMDTLRRLVAAHQVYASADHKGGYVTTRTLAALPVFHANNLDALLAGKIDASALESNASIFSRYVQSLPAAHRARAESLRTLVAGKAGHHRAKHVGDQVIVAHDPIHTLFLVPGTGPHPGVPGNYLHGSALQLTADENSAWAVHIHDSDDGMAVCDVPTDAAAFEKLQEVLASAPFNMNELAALGFRFK
ncbi:MAG: hypothetical protein H7343_13530 [Undibacterium sp.]|nr:hypothetical protein [Opitutaceae bacterium]